MATVGTSNNRLARVNNSRSTRNASMGTTRTISLNMKLTGGASEILSPRAKKQTLDTSIDVPAFSCSTTRGIPDGSTLRTNDSKLERLE